MGAVYRARHRELDKVVALKVLPADRVDEAAIARFRNEMKAAGQARPSEYHRGPRRRANRWDLLPGDGHC